MFLTNDYAVGADDRPSTFSFFGKLLGRLGKHGGWPGNVKEVSGRVRVRFPPRKFSWNAPAIVEVAHQRAELPICIRPGQKKRNVHIHHKQYDERQDEDRYSSFHLGRLRTGNR